MLSPLFYHPLLYRIFTMFYYKSQYQLRYKIITEEIKDGWVVNDICCGDAYLYEHLKKINASYHAYDINKIYVKWLRKRKIDAHVMDLNKDKLPSGDCLVLQSALYQFIPHHEEMMQKLFTSDHRLVIISEVINSKSVSSANPLIRSLARLSSTTEKGSCNERFNKETLLKLFHKYKAIKIKESDRDLVGIFDTKITGKLCV